MTDSIEDIAFRAANTGDHSFFYHSALKSYRDSPSVRGVPNTHYYKCEHDILERAITSPTSIAFVACNPDDSDQIYGYILGQSFEGSKPGTNDLALHWVYVKQPFRNFGIATKLVNYLINSIPFESVRYTHRVKSSDRLLKSYPTFYFDPFFFNEGQHG